MQEAYKLHKCRKERVRALKIENKHLTTSRSDAVTDTCDHEQVLQSPSLPVGALFIYLLFISYSKYK